MNVRRLFGWGSVVVAVAACGGCASFDHQAGVEEPHATVEFCSVGESTPPYREVHAFDGVRVRSFRGTRFRITPGSHELVFKDVALAVREGEPASFTVFSSGSQAQPSRRTVDMYPDAPPKLSGTAPLPSGGTEMINMRWHGWTTSYITNALTVAAGEHYVLDGYGVRQFGGKKKAVGTAAVSAGKKSPKVSRPTVTASDKKRAVAAVKQANEYLRKGRHDDAIAACSKAILLNPYGHQPYCTRGRSFYAKGQYDDAIADLTDAIDLKSSCHDAYCTRGRAHYLRKNYLKAVEDETKALGLRSGCVSSRLTRGRARAKLKQLDDALEDLSDVLRIKPDNADARFERGVVYLKLLRFKEGTADLRQCVTLKPEWKDRVQPLIGRYGKHRDVSPPLHGAVTTGTVALATQLLAAGAEVDSFDGRGRTPLHLAIYRKRPDMVSLLLERGADSVVRERTSGRTPLDLAAGLDAAEIVTLLLKHRSTSDADFGPNVAALKMACLMGATRTAEILLENGVPVAEKQNGATALMVAVMLGDVSMTERLLSHGANPRELNAAGNAALLNLSGMDWTQTNRTAVLTDAMRLGFKSEATKAGGVFPESAEDVVGMMGNALSRSSTHAVTDYSGCAGLLLAKGAKVDAQNPRGMTPLIHAAMSGNLEGVRFLIKHGADVGHRDEAGYSALESATEADRNGPEIVKLLLAQGADIAGSTKSGSSALHLAASGGRVDTMRALLDEGAGIEAKGNSGLTPLHGAAGFGHPEAVRLLLDRDARFNARGDLLAGYYTPLLFALQWRYHSLSHAGKTSAAMKDRRPTPCGDAGQYRQVVELLIGAGANVNARARNGMSALFYAADMAMADPLMVKLLLKHGADIHAHLKSGMGTLHLAASQGNLEVVTLLIDNGADVDRPGQHKGTPLHVATAWDHSAVVSLLLAHGADPNCVDAGGQAPLHVAILAGNAGIVRELAKASADLSAGLQTVPCLHLACALGRRRVVEQLLAARVDTRARTHEGMTPLACTFLAELEESACTDHLVQAHKARGRTLVIPPCDRAGVAGLLIDVGAGILINACDMRGRTALHGAATRGDTASVRLLLEQGADATLKDNVGSTPLDLARDGGHEGIVKLLQDTRAAM